VEILGILTI